MSSYRIADDVDRTAAPSRHPAPAHQAAASHCAAAHRAPSSPNSSAGDEVDERLARTARELAVVAGQLIRLLRRKVPAAVGPGSLGALATLSRCGPMRLGDLAVREAVAPPTLTRMVASMEEAGYLVRHPDPNDRRAVRVSITEAGRAVVADAEAARSQVLAARLARLPAHRREAIVAALPALLELADDGEADSPHP